VVGVAETFVRRRVDTEPDDAEVHADGDIEKITT
jgi:hypothetical protein